MRKDITITAEPRTRAGRMKRGACARKAPCLPLSTVARLEPTPVAVSPKELTKILNSKTGHNTIFNLGVEWRATPVMIVDWQYDPIKDRCCMSI